MSDSLEDEVDQLDMGRANAPAALFSLAPEDVLFHLDQTPLAAKVLAELPLYQPFTDLKGVNQLKNLTSDRRWQKPLAPVSKFVTGKMIIQEEGPARKRSRYEYSLEDETEDDTLDHLELSSGNTRHPLPAEQNNVALFNPENKHIIARLHAAHSFRPPSEFNMPAQSWFESRQQSQWTLSEDDELRKLVREYEYNWSLISACLSSASLFSSGAERRTPWECFERWVSFEGLPGDMARHQYFRAWNSRREGARQHLDKIFQAQQQAHGGAQLSLRRRSAEPTGVERRRTSKHFALIAGMQKAAKKRETQLQKQQHGMIFPLSRNHYILITYSSCLPCCPTQSQRACSAAAAYANASRVRYPQTQAGD